MNPAKTHMYLIPGLAANPNIFEHLQLPKEQFELHFLEWISPVSVEENLEDYSRRMAALVTHPNPILLGVSFGGIMAQEMSKHLNTKKIILISSVKSKNELPNRLRAIQKSNIYKLFPVKSINIFENFLSHVFGRTIKKRIKLYQKYLSNRDEKYLTWAIYNMLHWKQTTPLNNIVHIHGTDDHVFPIKHIKNCISVENGTHVMILFKAKTISQLIVDSF